MAGLQAPRARPAVRLPGPTTLLRHLGGGWDDMLARLPISDSELADIRARRLGAEVASPTSPAEAVVSLPA